MNKTMASCMLSLLFASGTALANGPGNDPCVIGTWVQSGGGPGEWMQQRMPERQVHMQFQQPRGVMTLERDGRYTASATNLGVDAIQDDPNGFRASLRAEASAAGRWSTRDRQLVLEASQSSFTASDDAVTQAAARLRARHTASGQSGRVFYGCRGDHLTTRTEVRPGESFPTHFVKVRGDGG